MTESEPVKSKLTSPLEVKSSEVHVEAGKSNITSNPPLNLLEKGADKDKNESTVESLKDPTVSGGESETNDTMVRSANIKVIDSSLKESVKIGVTFKASNDSISKEMAETSSKEGISSLSKKDSIQDNKIKNDVSVTSTNPEKNDGTSNPNISESISATNTNTLSVSAANIQPVKDENTKEKVENAENSTSAIMDTIKELTILELPKNEKKQEEFMGNLTDEYVDKIYQALVEKMVKGVAFNLHRQVKLEHTWLGDEEIKRRKLDTKDIYMNNETNTSLMTCVCPECGRKIGTSRFAPHLEKCSQRSSRSRYRGKNSHYSGISSAVSLQSDPVTSKSKAKNNKSSGSNQPVKKKSTPQRRSVGEPGGIIPCWACGSKKPPGVICDGCDRMYHDSCLIDRDVKKSLDPSIQYRFPTCFCNRCAPNIKNMINIPQLNKKKRKRVASTNGKATQSKIRSGRVPAPYEVLEFYCDVCNQAIEHSRWRCLQCNNFDSCLSCHEQKKTQGDVPNTHHPSHYMAQIAIEKNKEGTPSRH